MDTTITIATLNLRNGGYSATHEDYRYLPKLADVIGQLPSVDILFLQELRDVETDGHRMTYRIEQELSTREPMRTFVTRPHPGRLWTAVCVRWPRMVPIRHYPGGPDVHDDQRGMLHLQPAGMPLLLKAGSMHWPYHSGQARLDEAALRTRYTAPGELAILGGDFNSLWPEAPGIDADGAEPRELEPDWRCLPTHLQGHKTLPVGLRPGGALVSDRRALQTLRDAGFVSAGSHAGDYTSTLHPDADAGQGSRIDHLLLSADLAPALQPASYRVWATDASDHRMVSTTLDLAALTTP